MLAAELLDPDARLGVLEHCDDLFLSVPFPVGPISAQVNFQANGLNFRGKVILVIRFLTFSEQPPILPNIV